MNPLLVLAVVESLTVSVPRYEYLAADCAAAMRDTVPCSDVVALEVLAARTDVCGSTCGPERLIATYLVVGLRGRVRFAVPVLIAGSGGQWTARVRWADDAGNRTCPTNAVTLDYRPRAIEARAVRRLIEALRSERIDR